MKKTVHLPELSFQFLLCSHSLKHWWQSLSHLHWFNLASISHFSCISAHFTSHISGFVKGTICLHKLQKEEECSLLCEKPHATQLIETFTTYYHCITDKVILPLLAFLLLTINKYWTNRLEDKALMLMPLSDSSLKFMVKLTQSCQKCNRQEGKINEHLKKLHCRWANKLQHFLIQNHIQVF